MLCDDCKKNQACVHLTQITHTQKIDKHLCEECAKKYGELIFNIDQKFSVNDFLAGMFNNGLVEVDNSQLKEMTCPNCGMTYSDFSRTGKIGCSICYATFAKKLEPLLRRIHGASSHIGKFPKRSGGKLGLKQRIKQMRNTLTTHVANEEYEQAAKLRDTIKELEKELHEDVE